LEDAEINLTERCRDAETPEKPILKSYRHEGKLWSTHFAAHCHKGKNSRYPKRQGEYQHIHVLIISYFHQMQHLCYVNVTIGLRTVMKEIRNFPLPRFEFAEKKSAGAKN